MLISLLALISDREKPSDLNLNEENVHLNLLNAIERCRRCLLVSGYGSTGVDSCL